MMSNPSSQIRRVGSPRAHVDVVPRILRPVAARRLAVPVKVIKSFSFDLMIRIFLRSLDGVNTEQGSSLDVIGLNDFPGVESRVVLDHSLTPTDRHSQFHTPPRLP